MSDAFDVSLGKVSLLKYVDELQDELSVILKEVGPGKTEAEMEEGKKRIEDLLRKQAASLAKETGVTGNYAFTFMLMSSILMTAWTSFTIKRTMIDTTRPFEERLRLEELLSSLPLALSAVISKSAEHADMYSKK
ncbi:MAG: hypothetical protein ABR867_01160 [Nitrososphaerales archaeon]